MTVVVSLALDFDLPELRFRSLLDHILIQKRFAVFRILWWCMRVLFWEGLSLAWSRG